MSVGGGLPPWKRAMDVAGAVVLLVMLSPLLLCLAVAVRLILGSPVFFSQPRAGLRGRLFTLHKLRSMEDRRDESSQLLEDSQRITAYGAWLRSTSLDELPELWNVLRGDMSLVGPRPLLPEYLPRYSPEQGRRHEVRPGITGWAQVNGRNALSWGDRLQMDVWYVENLSLWLDLKILVRTLGSVVRRRGISQPGHATMPPFRGRAS